MYPNVFSRPRLDCILVHEYAPTLEIMQCNHAKTPPLLKEKNRDEEDGEDWAGEISGDSEDEDEGRDTTPSGDLDRDLNDRRNTPPLDDTSDGTTHDTNGDTPPSPTETPLVTPATAHFAAFDTFPGPQPQHGCIPPPVTCGKSLHAHVYSPGFLSPPCHAFALPAYEYLPESVTEFAIHVALKDEDEVHRRINAFMFGENLFPFGISLHRQIRSKENEHEAHTFVNIITPHNWRGLFEAQIRQILVDAVDDDSIM